MYLFMLVFRFPFLMIFASGSGCKGDVAKFQFSQKLYFSSFQGPFFMILNVPGTNYACCGLEGCLKCDELQGDSAVIADPETEPG